MENFRNKLTKSTTSLKPSFNVAGCNNENEMNPDMVLKLKGVNPTKKQTHAKNFMRPTISAANKKKILTERNENSDVMRYGIARSSKCCVFGDADGKVDLKPYDPVRNYLSPRPKFLRYNPNRRRKILKENDEGIVRNSTNSSINAGCGLELGVGSLGTTDSSSQKKSVERVENVIDKEGEVEDDEGDESEDDEEEVVGYEEDKFWSLKGLLKWSLVVVALVLMTQGICSVNSPTDSHALEAVGDFSDWSFVNTAAVINLSEAEESRNIVMGFHYRGYVYGATSVNYSKIGTGPVRDADLEARRCEKDEVNHVLDGIDMVENVTESVEGANVLINDVVVESVKESAEVENALIDDIVIETVEESAEVEHGLIDDVVIETVEEWIEVENGLIDDVVDHHIVRDETDVTDNEMSSKQADTDHSQLIEILPEQNIADIGVLEIDDVDFSQDVISEQLDEVVNDETDVVQDDMCSKEEVTDHVQRVDMLQEHESAETAVIETEDSEVKKEVSDQLLTVDLDQDGFGEDMNVAEKVTGDAKTTELATSDPAVTVLTGLVVLLLTSIGAIYHSKLTKSTPVTTAVQKEDLMEAKPSTNPSSLIQQKEEQTVVVTSLAQPKEEVSKENCHINAASVELLGEFVSGEEVTSSVRCYMSPQANAGNSLIQTTTVSFSRTNTSARKPRRRGAGSSSIVTPLPVRRSQRLVRRSVTSP